MNSFPLFRNDYGYESHRGVIVFWDIDHDRRAISLINKMPKCFRERLMAIREREGQILMLWADFPPEEYKDEVWIAGDCWTTIHFSVLQFQVNEDFG